MMLMSMLMMLVMLMMLMMMLMLLLLLMMMMIYSIYYTTATTHSFMSIHTRSFIDGIVKIRAHERVRMNVLARHKHTAG